MSHCTLAAPVSLSGVSLLSARASTLTISPAEKGAGITIARLDVSPAAHKVSPALLVPGKDVRTTSLLLPGPKPALINTVEHVLSALYGMEVTDAHVTVDAENVPILDGSRKPFIEAFEQTGIVRDGNKPTVLKVEEPIVIQDEKDPAVSIEIRPRSAAGCRFRYDFVTTRPVAAADGSFRTIEQSCIWEGDTLTYARELSPARTFSFKVEAEGFAQAGLFAHFTPADMLVVDDVTGHPVQNSYRYKNELARHKLVDLIGDLALVGRRLQMDIQSRRAGHALNHQAAAALFQLAARV